MRSARFFTFLILCTSLLAVPAFGAELTWTGVTNADWNTASNWTPQQAPVNGDTLTIGDVANMPTNLQSGFGTIHFTGGTLTMDGAKEFGPTASTMDTVFNQTGGMLKTGGRIILGVSNLYTTTYNLHDGASLEGNVIHVGNRSTGVWNIYAGASAALNNDLWVGLYASNDAGNVTGNGTINMYGDSLSMSNLSFGYQGGAQGAGNFYGGTVTASAGLFVGRGGTGTLLIDGANLTAAAVSNIGISDSGNGTGFVTIDSGSLTINNQLNIGNGTGNQGTLTLNGGNLSVGTSSGGDAHIGISGGTGTFYLNGGTAKFHYQDVYIGNGEGSSGYVYQTGGMLDATGKWFNIGERGTARYEISGGSMASNVLVVGRYSPGTMIMSEDDPSVPTTVTTNQFIIGYSHGVTETSSLVINGGTLKVTAAADAVVGRGGSAASFTLNDGEFNQNGVGNFVIQAASTQANNGLGTLFTVNGGTLDVLWLSLGQDGTSGGTVTAEINGGIVKIGNHLRVGHRNHATLTVSGGNITAGTLALSDIDSNKPDTKSVFNLVGSKSKWTLNTLNSNAGGGTEINLQLDSDGLSTLKVSGAANVNGTISDITSVPGVALVQEKTVVFVEAGSLTDNTNFTSAAFTKSNEGNKISFTFNDSNLQTLEFGGSDSITLSTDGEKSGWLRLVGADIQDCLTLQLELGGSLGAATLEDLSLFLNESVSDFGYSLTDVTPVGSTDRYYFDMPIDEMLPGETAYFGWDFGAFNAQHGAGIGLLGASSVPEPATWLMLLAGLAGLWALRKRGKAGV